LPLRQHSTPDLGLWSGRSRGRARAGAAGLLWQGAAWGLPWSGRARAGAAGAELRSPDTRIGSGRGWTGRGQGQRGQQPRARAGAADGQRGASGSRGLLWSGSSGHGGRGSSGAGLWSGCARGQGASGAGGKGQPPCPLTYITVYEYAICRIYGLSNIDGAEQQGGSRGQQGAGAAGLLLYDVALM
jgi:hypothetical protein